MRLLSATYLSYAKLTMDGVGGSSGEHGNELWHQSVARHLIFVLPLSVPSEVVGHFEQRLGCPLVDENAHHRYFGIVNLKRDRRHRFDDLGGEKLRMFEANEHVRWQGRQIADHPRQFIDHEGVKQPESVDGGREYRRSFDDEYKARQLRSCEELTYCLYLRPAHRVAACVQWRIGAREVLRLHLSPEPGSVLYLWPEACDSTDCEKPLARFELVVPRLVHEQTQGSPTVAIGTDEFGLHANFALYPTTLALMGPKPASATA